jgi:hypothetical protein
VSGGAVEHRFWQKVLRSDVCWTWSAAKDRDGYGWFKRAGKQVYAHRVSWTLHHGEIPAGLFVLHKCDNPSCVRPEHLFLGTNLDNVRDALSKGRMAVGDRNGSRLHPEKLRRGESVGTSKLKDAQVIQIRLRHANGEKQQVLADAFGVSNQQVSNIVRRASRRTA